MFLSGEDTLSLKLKQPCINVFFKKRNITLQRVSGMHVSQLNPLLHNLN